MTLIKDFVFTISQQELQEIESIRPLLSIEFVRGLICKNWGFGHYGLNQQQPEAGCTLLLAACANGVPEVALALIAHPEVDITIGDYFKQTPLSWCVRMHNHPESTVVRLSRLIEKALLRRLKNNVLCPLRQSYYQNKHSFARLADQIVQAVHQHVGDWSEEILDFKQELTEWALEDAQAWWKCRESLETLQEGILGPLRWQHYQNQYPLAVLEAQILQETHKYIDSWSKAMQIFRQEMVAWVLDNVRAWWKHCEALEIVLESMHDAIFHKAYDLILLQSALLNSPQYLKALQDKLYIWMQETIEDRPAHGDFLLEKCALQHVRRVLELTKSGQLLFLPDSCYKTASNLPLDSLQSEYSPKKNRY